MEYAIATENLTKKFYKYAAVNNLSIHVKKGDIYGFIGKNGAGKTTFLKMIGGLSHQTSGEITLFEQRGAEIIKNNTYRRIGMLIENPGLYSNLTAYENLKMKCLAVGKFNKSYIQELLELVGLPDVGKKKIKQFSLGMRQRLGIALALVGEPELLLLDEPINGLDPQGIAEIRNTILRLNHERELTIVISSHILEELSKIATSYGIIDTGKLMKEATREQLKANCQSRIEIRTNNAQESVRILQDAGVQNLQLVDERTLFIMERLNEISFYNEVLVKHNVQVEQLHTATQSIEEYFLQLTGGISV